MPPLETEETTSSHTNDAMSWDVFPLLFVQQGINLARIGLIKAVYPLSWSLGQLLTGPLSDRVGRKPLIMVWLL